MGEIGIRGYRADDFDALGALIDDMYAPARVMTSSGLSRMLSVPGYEPGTDLLVATAATGEALLGARDVRVTARGDEAVLILESWGGVHPDASSSAIEETLLNAAFERARRLLAERGRRRGILQARCGADDAISRRAYEAAGLSYARDLVSMTRPSLDEIEAPKLPPGVTLRGYRIGEDDDAWVRAFNAAFADHWGGFMGMSPARWAHDLRDPVFKPAISLVASAGDDLIGFCHVRIDDELNTLAGRRTGMIRYVGVVPAWRKKGLGAALTLAGLHAMRDAGMEIATLGVDAENVTGARHLYERFGFAVTGQQVMYRREITAEPG